MFRHIFTAKTLGYVVLMLAPAAVTAETTIRIDDFEDGNDDGWTHIDNLTMGGGPGEFDASSHSYRLYSTGLVPPIHPANGIFSAWNASEGSVFSHGFLRAKVQCDSFISSVAIAMRASDERDFGYFFMAGVKSQTFFVARQAPGDIWTFLGEGHDLPASMRGWMNLEAGIVNNQVSMKVWPDGEPEPASPQLTFTDPSPLPHGDFLVGTFVGTGNDRSRYLDATFDDIYFTPAYPGDYDGDTILTAEDIDLLTGELLSEAPRFWYDLNGDRQITEEDHRVWVKDLKNTWYGDANLDLEFNSSDMVQVFTAGKYETREDAGWGEGDWNADLKFTSSDMVAAFADGGYEKGRRIDVATVPEPASAILLLGSLIMIATHRRRFGR
jgi:hypothetical protein